MEICKNKFSDILVKHAFSVFFLLGIHYARLLGVLWIIKLVPDACMRSRGKVIINL